MNAFDTVTVVNKTADGYVTNIVSGAFWYRGKSINIQGHGVEFNNEPSCIFPLEALKNYSDTAAPGRFTLKPKDFIILGVAAGITSVKDVNQYEDVITIKSISKHLKGSPRIQHITVS